MPRSQPTAAAAALRPSAGLGAAFVLAAIIFQATLLGWPASLLSGALVIAYVLWISPSAAAFSMPSGTSS